MSRGFEVGDRVVYRKSKHSVNPGPRAREVVPSAHGDDYCYIVDKFWTVSAVLDADRVVCVTPGGKQHVVRTEDPCLKRANWLERWLYDNRFPELPATADTGEAVRSA